MISDTMKIVAFPYPDGTERWYAVPGAADGLWLSLACHYSERGVPLEDADWDCGVVPLSTDEAARLSDEAAEYLRGQ